MTRLLLLSVGFFGPLDVLRWAETSVLALALFRLPFVYLFALFAIRVIVGFGVVRYVFCVVMRLPALHEVRELVCRLMREGLVSQASPPSTVRLSGSLRELTRASMYWAAVSAVVFSWCCSSHTGSWLPTLLAGFFGGALATIYGTLPSKALDRVSAAFVLAKHAEQYNALREAYRLLH